MMINQNIIGKCYTSIVTLVQKEEKDTLYLVRFCATRFRKKRGGIFEIILIYECGFTFNRIRKSFFTINFEARHTQFQTLFLVFAFVSRSHSEFVSFCCICIPFVQCKWCECNYKNTWFLTFLGATWAGFERHITLELDQCSNSRTHQNLTPTKTHMEVHVLSNWIKHKELKNGQNWKTSYWTEKKQITKLEK